MTADKEVILFATNGDGTVDCAWCGETFNAEVAMPDDNCEPMCPECVISAEEEALAMSKEEYIEHLHFSDGDLSPSQLEEEWQKFEKWKANRMARGKK